MIWFPAARKLIARRHEAELALTAEIAVLMIMRYISTIVFFHVFVMFNANNCAAQISSVDFRNFGFPGFHDKRITLKDGKQEITRECGGTIYTLKDVLYVDFTRDGNEEALVPIEDFSGCGSSCVSQNYYIYTLRKGRPYLLWRLATGCQGLGGLKDFKLEAKELVFDVFGESKIVGRDIIGGDSRGECCPKHFTRIRVAWCNRRFRQISAKVFDL